MTEPRRRLTRTEIGLLKHLDRFASIGFPISVPQKFRSAFLPLWRLSLIEIWYRQDRDSVGGRRTQFISITVDGHKRIHALLSSTPRRSRASGSQGQSNAHDAASEPQQEEEQERDD